VPPSIDGGTVHAPLRHDNTQDKRGYDHVT